MRNITVSNKPFIPIVILFTILIALIFYATEAVACSCSLPKLPGLDNAIFSGKIINIKYLDNPAQNSPEPRIIVTFKVYRIWSGPRTKKFVINTVYNKWTCKGYYFQKDKEYFVVTYKRKPSSNWLNYSKEVYDVKLCGGTMPLEQAGDYIKQLGPGKLPQ